MKQGKTFLELQNKVNIFHQTKKDFLKPVNKIDIRVDTEAAMYSDSDDDPIKMTIDGKTYTLTETAHRQMANVSGIGQKYYFKCLDQNPFLLLENINAWNQGNDQNKMIRTVESSTVRAILSDRYKAIDNLDVFKNSLHKLSKSGNIDSCEIDYDDMFIKITFPDMVTDYKIGDPVEFGVIIRNNEVGGGSLEISQFCKRLVCTNGMTIKENLRGMNRRHIGSRFNVESYFNDSERVKNDAVLWDNFRKTIETVLSKEEMEKTMNMLREGGRRKIKSTKLDKVISALGRRFKLTNKEEELILNHLVNSNDMTAWGMANAVTRAGEDLDSYKRASEFEYVGYKVATMPLKIWDNLTSVN